MAKLDTDLLKRTEGLLAGIDEVLRKPGIADAVDRVIQSAAPSVNTYLTTLDEWDRDPDEEDPFWDSDDNNCNCEYEMITNEQTFTNEDGVKTVHVWDYHIRVCELDHLGRVQDDKYDPFQDPNGINVAMGHASSRPTSAFIACGAEGCACTDLFDEPEFCEFCERPLIYVAEKDAWVNAYGSEHCHAHSTILCESDDTWDKYPYHTPKEEKS